MVAHGRMQVFGQECFDRRIGLFVELSGEFEGQGNNNSLSKPLCKASTVQVSWALETVSLSLGELQRRLNNLCNVRFNDFGKSFQTSLESNKGSLSLDPSDKTHCKDSFLMETKCLSYRASVGMPEAVVTHFILQGVIQCWYHTNGLIKLYVFFTHIIFNVQASEWYLSEIFL